MLNMKINDFLLDQRIRGVKARVHNLGFRYHIKDRLRSYVQLMMQDMSLEKQSILNIEIVNSGSIDDNTNDANKDNYYNIATTEILDLIQ